MLFRTRSTPCLIWKESGSRLGDFSSQRLRNFRAALGTSVRRARLCWSKRRTALSEEHMRSDTFGRLLKAGIGSIATCEGKTAPTVEDDLGQQIGVTAASIQRYKAGHLPPEPRTVQILADA